LRLRSVAGRIFLGDPYRIEDGKAPMPDAPSWAQGERGGLDAKGIEICYQVGVMLSVNVSSR